VAKQIPILATRFAYIDWMRGLACVIMFQAHCYDSWLNPEARQSALYRWSQEASTLPAPIFIFLSGLSLALVTERLWRKGVAPNRIARRTILRGAAILALGILFRLQEYVLGYPKSPWTDMFRVDVLNILGLSIMLMSALCWLIARLLTPKPLINTSVGLSDGVPLTTFRHRVIFVALLTAALIALATPPLWTTHRPRWLPWQLETYLNGVHTFNQPQHWLFAIFPWSGFAFVGLAIGFLLFSDFARRHEVRMFALLGATGILAGALSWCLDALPIRFYAVYDYWHSHPAFFLMRCGVLLVLLFLIYAWCRWGLAQQGFSPMIQLGKTSLLVYWVHMEFVYGRFSILPKRGCTIAKATAGLIVIFAAMLALSICRTRWKKRAPTATVLRVDASDAAATAGSL